MIVGNFGLIVVLLCGLWSRRYTLPNAIWERAGYFKQSITICTLSFLVNIGNQCSIVQVTKCGCVGSYILYLLLPMLYCSIFLLYCLILWQLLAPYTLAPYLLIWSVLLVCVSVIFWMVRLNGINVSVPHREMWNEGIL